MKVIDVRNVNEALAEAIPYIIDYGVEEESRNGAVLVAPEPVCTVYRKPIERVLFSGTRDANPFFHLMEALWMLDGRGDLGWPLQFNKRFKEYSDNGDTIHGAYGWRWRGYFMFDQLQTIVDHLKKNPNSRRAVLSMWCADGDLREHQLRPGAFGPAGEGGLSSRDIPCNTHTYFGVRDGKLDMTVCNRSNDIIWGAYGANVVHFSMLQEYLAAAIGVGVGSYNQFSNNFHAYTDVYPKDVLLTIAREGRYVDYYKLCPDMVEVPLMSVCEESWRVDLENFLGRSLPEGTLYNDDFFNKIAEPMYRAWFARKDCYVKAEEELSKMPRCAWRLAAELWVSRRKDKNNAA